MKKKQSYSNNFLKRQVFPSGLLHHSLHNVFQFHLLIVTFRSVQLEPAYTNYSGITMSYLSSGPPQPAGKYYQG